MPRIVSRHLYPRVDFYTYGQMLMLIIVTVILVILILVLLWLLSRFPPPDDSQSPPSPESEEIEEESRDEEICITPIAVSQKHRSRGEAICCQAMNEIYGKPFTTMRPSWLINPETGRRMELDCYNEELRVAVEYNGKQHYVWPNYFSKSEDDFRRQARRDQWKVHLCDQQGVYLITVPYTIPHDGIKQYILEKLAPFSEL